MNATITANPDKKKPEEKLHERADIVQLARRKLSDEMKAFNEDILAKEKREIYRSCPLIMFVNATAAYVGQLMDIHEDLAVLTVQKEKSLYQCARHIMQKAYSEYGQTGDLPAEKFHEWIHEYYNIDEVALAAAKEAEKRAREEKVKALREKNTSIQPKEPKDNQVSLFDMLGETNDEKNKAIEYSPAGI